MDQVEIACLYSWHSPKPSGVIKARNGIKRKMIIIKKQKLAMKKKIKLCTTKYAFTRTENKQPRAGWNIVYCA